MAFTRFNYDPCRTMKRLQESTGPGRYILNEPGWGSRPCFFEDPQMRINGWGANLRSVPWSTAIDIDSDLLGITRKITKYCSGKEYPYAGTVRSNKIEYPSCKGPVTHQSRVTHPAWLYRDLDQTRRYPLFLNPQENTCIPFHNNLNTRLLESDSFVPKIPCLLEQGGRPLGVYSDTRLPPAGTRERPMTSRS